MIDTDGKVQQSMPPAGRESLIQSFSIEGLYGYRTIALSSEYAATIIIAKNGSGKTTLLAALDAFLRGQFIRLKDLEFDAIRCRIRGFQDELVLHRADLPAIFEASDNGELQRTARRIAVEPSELLDFLERETLDERQPYEEYSENKVYNALARIHGYERKKVVEYCSKLRDSYYALSPPVLHIRRILQEVMGAIDLVYLPTYRRIELPLADNTVDRTGYRRRRSPSMRIADTGLFTGSIQFGLGDVSDRLRQLNDRLLRESTISYREISADIITELLDGSFERNANLRGDIPDRNELEFFFARLKDSRERVGPYPEFAIPNIGKIYSGEYIPVESNRFLQFYLRKLNATIRATLDIEVIVKSFIDVCNKYLSRVDPSTVAPVGQPDEAERTLSDAKLLRLDRRTLSVYVESVALGRQITLNSLSSGEKQMISMFGKLYLYEREKVILIDEPELSLSIDWQQQILVDFMNSPSCRQVIAITHSPFVFDNELEPFARSMKSEIDLERGRRAPQTYDQDTDPHE